MVTTAQDNVGLVTGTYQIDKRNLTPEEWHQIIHTAVEVLTVQYLKGLVSVHKILGRERNCVRCEIDLDIQINDSLSRADLLECVTLKTLPHNWEEWSYLEGTPGVRDYAKESFLVFQRGREGKSQFAIITITWELSESISSAQGLPTETYRYLKAAYVAIENQVRIDQLFANSPHATHMGELILGAFSRAQRETANSLSDRAEIASRAATLLEGYRARLE